MTSASNQASFQEEFARRRQNLLRSMEPNSIAIIFSSPTRKRNHDVHYPYRQNSNFYYLTGYTEPEAVAVLLPNRKEGEYVLFCRDSDRLSEIWEGRRAGLKGAKADFKANEAYAISSIDEVMPTLMADKARLYALLGDAPEDDARVLSWLSQTQRQQRRGVSAPKEITLLHNVLGEARLFKSKHEQDLMRHAAKVSASAHKKAMQNVRPGMKEYHLEAIFNNEFLTNDCLTVAYPSIIGGGDNACILHYTDNNMDLRDGDLVLIDAGAEYEHYAADITRTFPVNGKFSPEQRAIYDLVLRSQLAALEKVKPGTLWDELQTVITEILTEGLVELGLLKGNVKDLIAAHAYDRFYMHRSGHWLGLDVHDAGAYKVDNKWRPLHPGMVLTVEPGLYIMPESEGVDPKWWGIGVRIEDDVLVTENGCDILSKDVPKSITDIEELMAASRK